MPYAFQQAGFILSTIFLGVLCLFAYMTVTFIIETMAVANALNPRLLNGSRQCNPKKLFFYKVTVIKFILV